MVIHATSANSKTLIVPMEVLSIPFCAVAVANQAGKVICAKHVPVTQASAIMKVTLVRRRARAQNVMRLIRWMKMVGVIAL